MQDEESSSSVADEKDIQKLQEYLQEQIKGVTVSSFKDTLKKVSKDIEKISSLISDAVIKAKADVLEMNHEKREKIKKMSEEVTDSNPYSRLMALQRMGIVKNYEMIKEKTVAVVGVGGVGSVAAEMLVRCGIGRLLLYDYDKVELANMNRLFYRPEHSGMSKTEAAAKTLGVINPDVEIEPYEMNITTVDGFEKFKDSLICSSDSLSRVDLLLSCVDNYEARITINQVCLELQQVWMESGVSEDAVAGHIQVIIPGKSACYQCVPPLIVASGIDEKTLKREGVCAASLPTTMGIVAGLLVQNALKYMLDFGSVTPFLGYNSLKDFFPSHTVMPNLECSNPLCLQLQQKLKGTELFFGGQLKTEEDDGVVIFHEDNEWQIEVVNEILQKDITTSTKPEESSSQSNDKGGLPEGIIFSMPERDAGNNSEAEVVTEADVGDLIAQLNALNSNS